MTGAARRIAVLKPIRTKKVVLDFGLVVVSMRRVCTTFSVPEVLLVLQTLLPERMERW